MLPPLRFRRALPADAAAVAALVNSAYRGDASRAGWTTEADLLGGQRIDAEDVAQLIAQDHSRFLLCLDGEDIIGCAHLEKTGARIVSLGMLVVRPVLQNRGLGRRLMAAAEDCAHAEWNAVRIEMQVIALRRELIAYYERRGYRRTGETRPFPSDPRFGLPKVAGLHFVVMEKPLAR